MFDIYFFSLANIKKQIKIDLFFHKTPFLCTYTEERKEP